MKKPLLLFLCIYLAGCVAGQQYSYETGSLDMPVKSPEKKTLVLSVQEWRPYVINGDKEANFVGLQRGGFGEPWDVTTVSGKPLTEVMTTAIASGLEDAGYEVINAEGSKENNYLIEAAQKNNASRIVVLKVLEWKSDVYMSVMVHSNLILGVHDAEMNLLAESDTQSVEKVGTGSWATAEENSKAVTDQFSRLIRNLFSADEVRDALQ